MKNFYALDDFPDFKMLTGQFPIIVEELKKNTFWMKWGSDSYDPKGHCQFLTGDWTICPIYFGNYDYHDMKLPSDNQYNADELMQAILAKFPESIKLLKGIESLNFAAFSRLHPKSKLAPHKHVNPMSLIFHMGLTIPAGATCGLTVGDETHIWTKPGEAVIFDDTHEHSAWNDSDEERIVLYVDFFEPEHLLDSSLTY